MHKEEVIKFGKSSAYDPDPGFFCRILQHCEIGNFSTMWLISPERVIGLSGKFCRRCTVGQESPCLNLEVYGYGFRIRIIFSSADACGLWLLLLTTVFYRFTDVKIFWHLGLLQPATGFFCVNNLFTFAAKTRVNSWFSGRVVLFHCTSLNLYCIHFAAF